MGSQIKKCVLLVAGDAASAQLLATALAFASGSEFQIECVSGASVALECLAAGDVFGVIVDLDIPGGQGIAVLEQLSSVGSHVPILVVASAMHESDAKQAVQRGAYDYLLKHTLGEFKSRRTLWRMVEEQRQQETAHLKQQCAEAALTCSGEAMLTVDNAERVRHMNAAAEIVTGWPPAEALGRPLDEVFQILEWDKRQEASGGLLTQGKYSALIGNGVLLRRDGVEVAIQHCAAPIRDRAGNLTGRVLVFHDVGAARAKTLQLSHLAQHDFLTDLPNRVLLDDRIRQAISFAERYAKKLAVMFVDLDHFKKINDTYGHAIGDALLQSVASRIVNSVRRSDTVSRHGGDEFIVLLTEVTHAEDSVFIARKILRALAAPFSVEQLLLCVSASIGVSTYPADGADPEILIHKADTALYDAKKLGRNNYQFFKPDMQARVLEWQSLRGNLRTALGQSEFMLHYQPKIDLKTSEVSGVEALLRWNHPDRGLVSPAQFIPIAEESGLIVPIGQWVLLEACRQARLWLDAGLPALRMAVNVSALQFMDNDFVSNVRSALLLTGIEPGNLELELTETVLMQDADSTIETLRELKDLGVQLAVDDFGTGYSSFSYLRKFPLDSLKVDRSFINEISPNSNNATILSALINIGKSLHHRVVAEGVETQEQFQFLQQQDCTEGQGYFFCHPVIAEKFAEFLETGIRESAIH